MTQTVLIIDFGSQVTQLIARRLREQGVYCEIVLVPQTNLAAYKLFLATPGSLPPPRVVYTGM